MNNFKHIGSFDYKPILGEVANSPLWNWLNLRRLAGHGDDIVLRYQSVEGLAPLTSLITDMTCVDYKVQALFPKTMQLIKDTFDQPIGRCVIARMSAGSVIEPHIDEGYYSENTDRYHFVITTNNQVQFYSGSEQFHMPRGEIYWFNNHITHKVENLGSVPRIHLIVDTVKD